eukprot:3959003-Alexandrium_andersonii.AAC.1
MASCAYSARGVREAMRHVRQMLPYKPRCSPIVRDSQGKVAGSAQEAADMWQAHSARKVEAESLSFSELASAHVESACASARRP